jgi:tRNA1Val (adenine37-N6)-methyltransferase
VTDETTGDGLTLDRLTLGMSVYQRRAGHRFSSDDVVTAWAAMQCSPAPARVLDLGCGLGSVLLHVAWCVPEARLVGVEAQDASFALLARNVAHNGVSDRVAIHHGDFRDGAVRQAIGAGFDLVTGTPPYFPPGTASEAQDRQRMLARVEVRGGIEAYVETAALALAPEGWFVVCGDADAEPRFLRAALGAGMRMAGRVVVTPRAGRPPLFTVWAARHGAASITPAVERDLVLRDTSGERTADARMLRAFSGFPEH